MMASISSTRSFAISERQSRSNSRSPAKKPWEILDKLDQRFFDLTVDSPGRPFTARAEPWAQRLPKKEDDRLYIAKGIATRAIGSGVEIAALAEQLIVSATVTGDHDCNRRNSDATEQARLEWFIAAVMLGEADRPLPR